MILGIAGHHNGSSLVVKTVCVGGHYRTVIHFESANAQRAVLEDKAGARPLRRFRAVEHNGMRDHRPCRRRHYLFAVMSSAISLVLPVSLVEAIDNLLNTRATVNVQRFGSSSRPCLQIKFAEVADVIGMKVSE